MSDLPEYLERADIDGTFALNILQLPLRVRTTPTPLQIKWSARTKCDEPPRGIPGLDPAGMVHVSMSVYLVGFGQFTAAGCLNSSKPQIKYIRCCPLKMVQTVLKCT